MKQTHDMKGAAVPNTVHIPASIDDAFKKLSGIEALLMATEWERAAIVYAFTYEGTNQHDEPGKKFPGRVSISDFAALGIKGLTSTPSVRVYRTNWKWAVDNDKALPAEPGKKVVLPDATWPGVESRPNTHRVGAMNAQQLAADVVNRDDAAAVINGMLRSAAGRKLLREVIAENPDMVKAITRRHEVTHPTERVNVSLDDWETWTKDYKSGFDDKTVKAVRQILFAQLLRQRGYEPSAEALMHLELVRPSDLDADLAALVEEVTR